MIWRLLSRPTVRVHLKGEGEPSLEGILVSNGPRHLKLVGARCLTSADSSWAIDGTAIIPRAAVAFWQELAS